MMILQRTKESESTSLWWTFHARRNSPKPSEENASLNRSPLSIKVRGPPVIHGGRKTESEWAKHWWMQIFGRTVRSGFKPITMPTILEDAS
ncbi:hypothetical protein LENED_003925 [Lentinula edodes]|uniref:Uncharacterized protein n=1 Tax=Lentinula edodes TaxID=5353 RepID=A0A1Q3E4W5_LENED|nr:hypothetical protein LENED_003925 [Lentinula edodes]